MIFIYKGIKVVQSWKIKNCFSWQVTLTFTFQKETKHHITNHLMVEGLEQHQFHVLIKKLCKFMYFGIVLNIMFVSQSLETFLTYQKVYDKHSKSWFKIKRVILIVHYEQTNAFIKTNQAQFKMNGIKSMIFCCFSSLSLETKKQRK